MATGRVPDRGRGSPRGYVGVVGPSEAADEECALAREVGALLAGHGFAVITGGLGGIMRAASQGTAEAGGLSIGLLPGASRDDANPHVTIALPTGMGEMRNALLVRSCDAIIAVGGSWGTLSEVALACRAGLPVVALGGWDLPVTGGPAAAATPAEAVDLVLSRIAPA
ncbi:MAG: TIGR00725 family protein [Ornithinimicrobium sp.]|uniref:TIGR00725 family protein n=1 Tax=Ornithinimicrobium sp. TaxID=1977084 RepID=UPI003D9B15FC